MTATDPTTTPDRSKPVFRPLVSRAIFVAASYAAASLAAGAVISAAAAMTGINGYTVSLVNFVSGLILTSALAGVVVACVVLVPAITLILICERMRLRSWWIYALAGVLAWQLVWLFIAGPFWFSETENLRTLLSKPMLVIDGAGFVGGFVHWAIAGRSAGMVK